MDAMTCTISEAASLLGVSPSLAYELAKDGHLVDGVRVIRVGRRMVVPRCDIERLLGPIPESPSTN